MRRIAARLVGVDHWHVRSRRKQRSGKGACRSDLCGLRRSVRLCWCNGGVVVAGGAQSWELWACWETGRRTGTGRGEERRKQASGTGPRSLRGRESKARTDVDRRPVLERTRSSTRDEAGSRMADRPVAGCRLPATSSPPTGLTSISATAGAARTIPVSASTETVKTAD
jgi:hypothetical protein